MGTQYKKKRESKHNTKISHNQSSNHKRREQKRKLINFPFYHREILEVQSLRINLPMQGTQVQSLVQEDLTCCEATKHVHHNYRAHEPQLLKPVHSLQDLCVAITEPACCSCTEGHMPTALLYNERSHCNKKPVHHGRVTPTCCNQRKSTEQ